MFKNEFFNSPFNVATTWTITLTMPITSCPAHVPNHLPGTCRLNVWRSRTCRGQPSFRGSYTEGYWCWYWCSGTGFPKNRLPHRPLGKLCTQSLWDTWSSFGVPFLYFCGCSDDLFITFLWPTCFHFFMLIFCSTYGVFFILLYLHLRLK